MTLEEDAKKALDLPLGDNDAEAATVREYLKALLEAVLIEEESFSGKRPFGNSGWIYDLQTPIEEAGLFADCDDWNVVFRKLVEVL